MKRLPSFEVRYRRRPLRLTAIICALVLVAAIAAAVTAVALRDKPDKPIYGTMCYGGPCKK